MFISTKSGAIALNRIIRKSASADRKQVVIYYQEAGEVHSSTAPASEWDFTLMTSIMQMVPAQPGTYALSGGVEDGKWVSWKTNVVAWSCSADGIFWGLYR